ncbi:hypothetical protein S141_1 [Shewanella sp. phage 1/41]|uniref:hypothetical protein n=1 Tax=Shewanella sp. phage 1/41 TaxID=1458861 RepID=UPI0004F6804B|nr:hypothetical protein S141_1 [Shewanella sp. phage 1/41]AHK11647.1 hypothetical protein S141_1 [Shewanella sp. phage 1/41]
MNTKARIKDAVKSGVKIKSISDKAEVSYFRLKSVINPLKYKGETSFDRFEEDRINKALDDIKGSF